MMANGFMLHIVTPDGVAYEGDVSSLIFRATDGDVCIQKNHTDYITTLDLTEVRILPADDSPEMRAACSKGFFTVAHNDATLVATTFELAGSIDVVRAESAKERAQKILEEKDQNCDLQIAEMKLKRALLRLKVANS